MAKRKKHVWKIDVADPPLTVELRPIFGYDIITIERENGEFIPIRLEEAEHLAEILPVVVAEARKRAAGTTTT